MSSDLVFILGITPRSGTNLLYHALLEHPDCIPARPEGEDFLVRESIRLGRYVDSVADRWNPEWDADGTRSTDLALSIGRGLSDFLEPDEGAPVVVTKTPSAEGIEHAGRFFPDARMLVLVRDGRDVAESSVRSFGLTYGEAFRRWDLAARRLALALDRFETDAVRVVRFEKLVKEPTAEMTRVLEHCGLDAARYDFDAAATLPVYGSSTARGGADEVHWAPVDRPDGFDPVGRWSAWDDVLKTRFQRMCGTAAEGLGYGRERIPGGAVRRGIMHLAAALDRR